MTASCRRILCVLAGLATVAAVPSFAIAQTYPTRAITVVVPYPAGGPTDLIGRLVADGLRERLGQPVVVENVPGASGGIGVGRVVRAVPDGYTLQVGNNGSNVLNGALYALAFDLLTDLAPIAQLTTNPQIIISANKVPAKTLSELIGWLKANDGAASVGIAGILASVNAHSFQSSTTTRLKMVPYRGAAPAVQDLVGGHIDLMFDQLSNALPHVKAGSVRAYAVAAPKRAASLPEVATVDEAGLPGFYGSLWHGLWAPKGTPNAVVDRLNAAVRQTLADPAVKQRLDAAGQDVLPSEQQSPAALAQYQKAEADKWWPVVKAANLKGE